MRYQLLNAWAHSTTCSEREWLCTERRQASAVPDWSVDLYQLWAAELRVHLHAHKLHLSKFSSRTIDSFQSFRVFKASVTRHSFEMSLFGNLGQQNSGTSLFGNSTQNKPSLFGNSTNTTNQPQQTPSLFGASQQPQNQQQQTSTPSLFGNNNNQNTTSNNLFGQSQAQQNSQQNAGTSLFGGQQNTQQQNIGSSLFGGLGQSTQNQQQPGTSLLQSTNQQPQNMAQSRLGMSIAEASNRRNGDKLH